MTTFKQLTESAKNKGFKIESFTNIFDRFGDMGTMETTLSIKLEDYVWYTWTIWSEDVDDRDMFFEGRYNQCNGAKQKTYKKERKALEILGL